jgi:hypothetical protein
MIWESLVLELRFWLHVYINEFVVLSSLNLRL